MKIFEFLQEDNGRFSSTRLFALAIVTSAIIEWQHAIWYLGGIWKPDYMTVGLIAGVLGIKVLQKSSEEKVDVTTTNSTEFNTKENINESLIEG
jgi:hypothetical protein